MYRRNTAPGTASRWMSQHCKVDPFAAERTVRQSKRSVKMSLGQFRLSSPLGAVAHRHLIFRRVGEHRFESTNILEGRIRIAGRVETSRPLAGRLFCELPMAHVNPFRRIVAH